MASIDDQMESLIDAARDMLSGWQYIRERYGNLDGVGWDRAESGIKSALEKYVSVKEANDSEVRRLKLIANDARDYLDGMDAGSLAALSESVGAWERGEDLDDDDLAK